MDETPVEPSAVERELRARVVIEEPEPQPAPSPPGRSPLRRRASRRLVAGVAGGLADHWGIPSLVLRIPLAAAAAVWGLLLLDTFTNDYLTFRPGTIGFPPLVWFGSLLAAIGYVALWIVVPREDVGGSPASRLLTRYPGMRSWPGFVLLGIGGALLADRLGIFEPTVVVAFGMIALGIWLFRRDGRRDGPVERSRTELGAPAPAPIVALRGPRPPRERSPLGWIAFGAALLVMCVAAIWSAGTTSFHPEGGPMGVTGAMRISSIPALGLLVLAAGLLVGSVFGRARWLILPSVLLVPVVLLSSVIRLPLEGRFGDLYFRPHEPGELGQAYHNSAGGIFVDLKRFQGRADLELRLDLSTVVGDVQVVVPYDARVVVTGHAGLGSYWFGRKTDSGLEVSGAATLEPKYGDGATFILNLETGIGRVSVGRYAITRRELRELRETERRAEAAEERTAA